MSTNRDLLASGFKKLLILLGLLIVSPLVLNVGFKALKKFTEYPKLLLAYSIFGFAILLILFTVYFGFKTFKTFLDALFSK